MIAACCEGKVHALFECCKNFERSNFILHAEHSLELHEICTIQKFPAMSWYLPLLLLFVPYLAEVNIIMLALMFIVRCKSV